MKTTVRDIIVNAMAEARLVNRNQPIPGSLFVDAFSLLKKRLDQYSNTNYLSFIRKEVNFEANKNEIVIGKLETNDNWVLDTNFFIADNYTKLPDANTIENKQSLAYIRNNIDVPGGTGVPMICRIMEIGTPSGPIYTWVGMAGDAKEWGGWKIYPDVEVDNLQEVVRVYVGDKDNWDDLKFVAYEDYYDYSNNYVYSVLPMDDEHVKLFLKTKFKNVKVIYNEAFDFGPDDELNIPRQFISLFTSALVYDLACQFPRLGDTTVALLKQRLDELEENVRRSSSVNKFIGRDLDTYSYSYRDGLSGAFLWR